MIEKIHFKSVQFALFSLLNVFLILFASSSLNSQVTFMNAYGLSGSDIIYDVASSPDGGYIGVGASYSFIGSASQLYIIKVNNLGTVQWAKTYGFEYYNFSGISIASIPGVGYTIIGTTDMPIPSAFSVTNKGVVLQIDEQGNLLLSNVYPSYNFHSFNDITRAAGTNFYIAAIMDSRFSVIKLSAAGAILWTKSLATSGYDSGASAVSETTDGGCVVVGEIYNPISSYTQITRFDGDGNMLWTKYLENCFAFKSICRATEGGFIIGGSFDDDSISGTASCIIQLDDGGNLVWSKYYDVIGNEYVDDIIPTEDGSIVLIRFTSEEFSWQTATMKLDSDGNVLWQEQYGATSNIVYDRAESFIQTSDNGLLIAGNTGYFVGSDDIFLIKTDTEGNSVCSANWSTSQETANIPTIQFEPSISQTTMPEPLTLSTTDSTFQLVSICPVEISELHSNAASLGPNPFHDYITVSFHIPIDGLQLQIVNCQGSLVFSDKVTQSNAFRIPVSLTTGIYYVQVIKDNTVIFKEKLLKQ